MSSPKEIALSACRRLMEPIIAILLRNGLTYKDLSLLCKQIYVSVASREFGIRGRDTNLSRVAMLTGIDRKEVSRIKDGLKNHSESDEQQHNQDRMSRVLAGWFQDPDFVDANGYSRVIPSEGDTPSFAVLVRRYGGDMPAVTLLKELKRSGSVHSDEQGNLHLMKRYYMPTQSDPSALLRAGSVINDLGSALYNNLYKADPEKNKPLYFEGHAINVCMSPEDAPEFHQFVDKEGQAFLEKIDEWLSAREQRPSSNATKDSSQGPTNKPQLLRLGVGAYLIQSNAPETEIQEDSVTPESQLPPTQSDDADEY